MEAYVFSPCIEKETDAKAKSSWSRQNKEVNVEGKFVISDWDYDLPTRLGNFDYAEIVRREREFFKE